MLRHPPRGHAAETQRRPAWREKRREKEAVISQHCRTIIKKLSAQCSDLDPCECLSSRNGRRERSTTSNAARACEYGSCVCRVHRYLCVCVHPNMHMSACTCAHLSENYHPRQHTYVVLQRLRVSSHKRAHHSIIISTP